MSVIKRFIIPFLLLLMISAAVTGCTKHYDVTFVVNDGDVLISGETEQKVISGEAAIPPVVTNGDKHLRWSGDTSCITSDSVFEAEWGYYVSFHINGGTLVDDLGEYAELEGDTVSVFVPAGESVTPPELEKGGYSVVWDADLSSINCDTHVFAVWGCYVDFNMNGGKLVTGDAKHATLTDDVYRLFVPEDSEAVYPEIVNDTMHLVWKPAELEYPITHDTEVNASWGYKVVFDPNGGVVAEDDAELTEQLVGCGETAFAPEVTNTVNGIPMNLKWDSDDYLSVTSDLTVTAQWSRSVMSETMDDEAICNYISERTVTVYAGDKSALGFFINDSGTVVTNYNVIEGASSASVVLSDGSEYAVTSLTDYSKTYDIAVLNTGIAGNAYLDVCEEGIADGEELFTFLTSDNQKSLYHSAVTNSRDRFGLIDCMLIDFNADDGKPLVNQYGELVGFVSFNYTSGSSYNRAISIGMLSKLDMDKNQSMAQYAESYANETANSYTVYSSYYGSYGSTTVKTYQYVTGRSCFASIDKDNISMRLEYARNYPSYAYTYSESEFSSYIGYLESIGFVGGSDGGGTYTYINYKDCISVTLSVSKRIFAYTTVFVQINRI